MRAHRVLTPGSTTESWTLLGDDLRPVDPVEPFLQHIASGRPGRTRTIKLKSGRKHLRVLTAAQAQKILDCCEHLRNRLLFASLLDTGVRVGEALGLRHEDIEIAEKQVMVVPRDNDNRARAKAGRTRVIPASAELMRLYSDCLHREYGALDSDYVFVNLFAEPNGRPWAYPAVYDLVRRLRKTTGIAFEPHQYRHTATWLLRRGAGPVGHSRQCGGARSGRGRPWSLPPLPTCAPSPLPYADTDAAHACPEVPLPAHRAASVREDGRPGASCCTTSRTWPLTA
ncbi:tyrosine-type recombinase/integrase [Streptomyces brasiliensis]|uniref:Tyr recombinase domain-containing protein n=1 Tax=Streptomyces brasiliensis TaxID=1954 RepID=A0A917KWN9_9ACTN|nr:tyrosine-type recombinase/integrase [Streptomyces brasiliensis]GGJ33479.1 hypothetical protein GCM10010121_050810 [Streptomyces brasiliensis]